MSTQAKTLQKLYDDYFHVVSIFIQKNSGTQQDAEDIFQEAMIVLIEKLKQDDFELSASLKTYVMAICKNLWFKHLRDNKKHTISELPDNFSDDFFEDIALSIDKEKTYWDRLSSYLSNVSDHCKKLLDMFYFERKTIDEIQKHFGYSTKHNAQNQKYKCVEQVKAQREKDNS